MDEKIRDSFQIKKAKELLAQTGKTAVEVIGDYLYFLWNHTLENIIKDQTEAGVDGTPFRVVITVPAVWNQKANARMRKAALAAGILDQRLAGETILHIVSEPEAAALATFEDMKARDFKVGDSIVVCDAGGGTVVSFPLIFPQFTKQCRILLVTKFTKRIQWSCANVWKAKVSCLYVLENIA